MTPLSPRHAAKHQAEKRLLLRMEFATFCAAMIQMPCQIVRSGGRFIYRLLSWNPWQGAFSDSWSGCTVAGCAKTERP